MFDKMKKVGSNIAKFRKDKNMTQVELADKMRISFQAISSWERGKTMPDIMKVPELAECLNVSIEDLLGTSSKAIESIVNSNLGESINEDTYGIPEKYISERIEDLPDIEGLLPFLSNDVINSLAMKVVNRKKYQDLNILAPFVSKNIIDDIARQMISEDENITNIAPFISKETMYEIAEEVYQKYGIKSLHCIAPFMQKEQLVRFAEKDHLISGHYCWELIAPYIDRKELNIFLRNQNL